MLRLILIDDQRQGYVDLTGQCYELAGALITYGISYTVLDEAPTRPDWYTPPAPPAPPPPPTRHITKLAFRNRFTMEEKATIELAAVHNFSASLKQQQTAAYLRAMLADQRDATYIDLDRGETQNGLIYLEEYGLLSPGRALQIINNQINDDELYRPEA